MGWRKIHRNTAELEGYKEDIEEEGERTTNQKRHLSVQSPAPNQNDVDWKVNESPSEMGESSRSTQGGR